MPTLHESLRAFSAAVFAHMTVAQDPGLAVYARNLRLNFARVLALEFPAVERLLGSERFACVALDYQRQRPSRRGNLHHIGADFAAYLASSLEPGSLRWIADVAALEWAWEEAAVAADDDRRIDPATLAGMPPEQLWTLRLLPHPALRIVRSSYPIHSIWQANLPNERGHVAALEPHFSLSLDQGAESVLIERPGNAVGVQLLTAAEAAWYATLLGGAPLGAAVDSAIDADAAFDLSGTLATALARRRLIAIHP